CRASQPALQALSKKYQSDVTFIGLNFDYTETRARRAIESIRSPWPQVLLGPWGTDNATLSAYGGESIPSLWLIDRQGRVAAAQIGIEELDSVLASALKQ